MNFWSEPGFSCEIWLQYSVVVFRCGTLLRDTGVGYRHRVLLKDTVAGYRCGVRCVPGWDGSPINPKKNRDAHCDVEVFGNTKGNDVSLKSVYLRAFRRCRNGGELRRPCAEWV